MKSFTTTFSRHIQPTDTIILAISGGVDSMVLLHLVSKTHPKDKIVVAHFDHALRGAESDGDRELVAQVANEMGIVFEYEKKDIGALAKAEKSSLEAVARRERYAFLERVRTKYGARYILTAHHADDQAETILMNLIKWGKLYGLSGMSVVSGNILRPFLWVAKSDIRTYAQEYSINYREDSSNQDTDYERNRIRWDIMPLIRTMNPSIEETLAELGSYIQDVSLYMVQEMEDWLRLASENSWKSDSFLIPEFASESEYLQKEILTYLYRDAHGGSTQWLSRGLLDELRRFVLEGSNSHGQKIIRELRLERRGERVYYSL